MTEGTWAILAAWSDKHDSEADTFLTELAPLRYKGSSLCLKSGVGNEMCCARAKADIYTRSWVFCVALFRVSASILKSLVTIGTEQEKTRIQGVIGIMRKLQKVKNRENCKHWQIVTERLYSATQINSALDLHQRQVKGKALISRGVQYV